MTQWLIVDAKLDSLTQSIKDKLSGTEAEDLTVRQVHVMAALFEKDCQKASDLAHAVGVPATSFTPILDKMETMALIKRKPHPTDRRAVIISLTVKGKSLEAVIGEALK